MKKLLTAIIITMCFGFVAKAQYVNILDNNFRYYLNYTFPSCFNSSLQLDTTCNAIISAYSLTIDNKNISNLDGIQYFKSLAQLFCRNNQLTKLPKLPPNLQTLYCDNNLIDTIKNLPNKLGELNCSNNKIKYLSLPNNLSVLKCGFNLISNLDILPDSLGSLECNNNLLDSLPLLPKKITFFDCSYNKIKKLISLPEYIYGFSACNLSHNQLKFVPKLPTVILGGSNNAVIDLSVNQLETLPPIPENLFYLACDSNNLNSIPSLPSSLQYLSCSQNNITCLPQLPKNIYRIYIDSIKVLCISGPNCQVIDGNSLKLIKRKQCNPVINVYNCQPLPLIRSFAYIDANSNNKFNGAEFAKSNVKISVSNGSYFFTNNIGNAEIAIDSLISYTVTATPPRFYNAVPSSYTHTFSSYDTLVMDTFALQPITLKDSIAIKLISKNWAARPGFAYPYFVSYENVGTKVLSNAAVSLHYDNSIVTYDSSSNNTVTNNGNSLALNIGNLVPGQTGSFMAYFKVKTSAVLGSSFTSIANITTNTVSANDTVKSTILGSYDPNDKQATPTLTLQDVVGGKNIDYTIRFQNTGTDTAFNVVIADTLDSKLMATQLQMVGSSHNCKTTVKENVVFFEFLNILLPDSNVNKIASNGFVSFRIKPIATITDGAIIPNKAAIYFDYNSPVITKPATTIIQNSLPLQLLSLSAIPQNDLGTILVYWNTANEINTAYFIVETSSNGSSYTAMAEVAAKGFGNNSYFYAIDKSNVVFVRLKMVDKNGFYTYSNVVKLSSNTDLLNGLMVLKNPTKHQLHLKVNATSLNHTAASLVNAQGNIVKRFILLQGSQTIDITSLHGGLYYLQTISGTKKIVVE